MQNILPVVEELVLQQVTVLIADSFTPVFSFIPPVAAVRIRTIISNKAIAFSKMDNHWQVDKSLVECNQYMFEHEHHFNDAVFKLDYKNR